MIVTWMEDTALQVEGALPLIEMANEWTLAAIRVLSLVNCLERRWARLRWAAAPGSTFSKAGKGYRKRRELTAHQMITYFRLFKLYSGYAGAPTLQHR